LGVRDGCGVDGAVAVGEVGRVVGAVDFVAGLGGVSRDSLWWIMWVDEGVLCPRLVGSGSS
jgi:hypothetical protein